MAQIEKFNKVYTNGRISRNIVELDSGYVVVGSNGSPVKILVGYIDNTGINQWNKEYGDSINTYYHGIENSLKSKSNSYILGGSIHNTDFNGSLLVCFNEVFDTVQTKIYLYDTLLTGFYGSQYCENNNNLLVGLTSFDDQGIPLNNSDILLLKTDSLGNMIWYKNYGLSDEDYGYKVLETYDNGYLIGGWSRSFNTQVAPLDRGDWYIVKTDTAGVFHWQRHYGNPDYEDGRISALVATPDSGYIIAGQFTVGESGGDELGRGRIIKLNKNYNILWDKLYDTPSKATYISNLKVVSNDTLIALGSKRYTDGTRLGSALNLTNDGKIRWKRYYTAYDTTGVESFAIDVIVTKDSGYAITGWAWDLPHTPSQQIWVVKTDSLGCDDVGSCADTAMFFNISVADTVCFEDTARIYFNLNGKSAPYVINCNNGWSLANIFYPHNGNSYIDTVYEFIPTIFDTTYTFSFTLTDPWGATKTGVASFYVKDCGSFNETVCKTNPVKIYPNPTNDEINIEFNQPQNSPVNVSIINSNGKEIFNKEFKNYVNSIKISGLKAKKGVYFIKLVTENEVILEKLIIN